jgi:hypothetical protein
VGVATSLANNVTVCYTIVRGDTNMIAYVGQNSLVVFWSDNDMFNKNFRCVNPYNYEVGNKFAEAMYNFPGHKIVVGSGDCRVWNVGGDSDNPVDFDGHSLVQLRPTIARCPDLLCINHVVRFRTIWKRDDWHFAGCRPRRHSDRALD